MDGRVSPDGTTAVAPLGTAGAIQTAPVTNKDYSVQMAFSKNVGNLSSGFYKVRIAVALAPQ